MGSRSRKNPLHPNHLCRTLYQKQYEYYYSHQYTRFQYRQRKEWYLEFHHPQCRFPCQCHNYPLGNPKKPFWSKWFRCPLIQKCMNLATHQTQKWQPCYHEREWHRYQPSHQSCNWSSFQAMRHLLHPKLHRHQLNDNTTNNFPNHCSW